MTFFKRDFDVDQSACFFEDFDRRLVNGSPGKVGLIEPWIVMGDVADGACVRGRITGLRVGYTGFIRLRPLDSAGAWGHFQHGLFYPRNGPEDVLPRETEW
jgi:hypothetical protein